MTARDLVTAKPKNAGGVFRHSTRRLGKAGWTKSKIKIDQTHSRFRLGQPREARNERLVAASGRQLNLLVKPEAKQAMMASCRKML